jgi:hypothetical protein
MATNTHTYPREATTSQRYHTSALAVLGRHAIIERVYVTHGQKEFEGATNGLTYACNHLPAKRGVGILRNRIGHIVQVQAVGHQPFLHEGGRVPKSIP